MSGVINNSSYDPLKSFLTFTSIYGDDTLVSMGDLEAVFRERITQGILFGVKIGAASLTLIIMWMLSRKRTTPIFIINLLSLFFTIFHASLYFNYLLTGYGGIAYTLTSFPQLITGNDLHVYATTNIVEVLLVASIETSLVFQVKVMFTGDNHKKLALLLVGVALALALATVGLYFATAIRMTMAAYEQDYSNNPIYFNVSLFLLEASVILMTLMLTAKLILAIRSRRFLGLKQFDSFHILLIMSCQTLVAPSILFILGFILKPRAGNEFLITVAQLLVVLSLPLSSLWATAANDASASGSGMSSKESIFGNDSLYSKSKCSQFRKTFMNRFSPKSIKNDEVSESAFVAMNDLEGKFLQEYATPVSGAGISSQNTSTSSQKKEPYVYMRSLDEDKGSISSDASGSSARSTPVKMTSTLNSEDLPPHILHAYDDDEGLLETKKIVLKKF